MSATRNARSQLPVQNLRTTTRNIFLGMPLLQTPTGGNTVFFPFMLFDAKSTLLHACPRGHQYTDKARCSRRHARRLLPHACTQHTHTHAHMLREDRALERARESVCANVRLFLCEYACMYLCLCVSVDDSQPWSTSVLMHSFVDSECCFILTFLMHTASRSWLNQVQ